MGTTSACAENTLSRAKPSPKIGNYLRVRGEYRVLGPKGRLSMELPPRARRIRKIDSYQWDKYGTTSACAENTVAEATGL